MLASQGIIWQTLETPYTIKDSILPGLGSTKSLAENVFYLHKPGDIIPKILDFGSSKNVMIKLLSRRNAENPSDTDITLLQKQITEQKLQEFTQTLLKDWKESYEQKGKIKMNPALIP